MPVILAYVEFNCKIQPQSIRLRINLNFNLSLAFTRNTKTKLKVLVGEMVPDIQAWKPISVNGLVRYLRLPYRPAE